MCVHKHADKDAHSMVVLHGIVSIILRFLPVSLHTSCCSAHTEGLKVGKIDLSQSDMTVIVLKDITTDTEASVETLLEVLSEHIDTLADASHYFVIDPTGTTIMKASITGVSVRVFCMYSHVHTYKYG